MVASSDHATSRADWVQAALERYEQPLIRYAARFTGDLERAREVVQDTFMKLCAADRGKVEARLAPWLYTVCRNRALDVRDKEGRMKPLPAYSQDAIASKGAGPREMASLGEAQQAVTKILAALPEDQQEAFYLKYRDQLTYREIGGVMGKSLGTVSQLIGAALGTVREQLMAGGHLGQEG